MHQMINIPVGDWKTSMIVPANIAEGKKKKEKVFMIFNVQYNI